MNHHSPLHQRSGECRRFLNLKKCLLASLLSGKAGDRHRPLIGLCAAEPLHRRHFAVHPDVTILTLRGSLSLCSIKVGIIHMQTAPKQDVPTPSISAHFTNGITSDTLAAWAGEAVFQRGHAYYKAGKVRNIALASEGRVLATVDGTRKYATMLFRKSNGELASLCTCPYGARCKHAVALAYACLALFAEKRDFPLASDSDKRLLDLDITLPDETMRTDDSPSPQALEAALNTLSKKQLVALVLQAASLAPEIAALCPGKADPQPKDALALVKAARKAIRKAMEEPDWDYHYRGNPDYASVCRKLEDLRLAGFPAEVLELGFDLIEGSRGQIEMSDDEGETQGAVSQCMNVVLQALRDVGWPVQKKLIWAADAVLTDEFAVCDCFWEILNETHPPAEWNPLADALLSRVTESYRFGHRKKRSGRSAQVV